MRTIVLPNQLRLTVYTLGTAIALVTALLFTFGNTAQAAPLGVPCITYGGQPLCTENAADLGTAVFGLRTAHAQAPLSMTMTPTETGALAPLAAVSDPEVFGVTEEKEGGWLLLLESVYKTDTSNGRFAAVVPGANEHGDWPPHGLLQKWSGTCDAQVTAEISMRFKIVVDKPCTVVFEFRLNPEHLDEYSVLATNGGLGYFFKSPSAIVNGETITGTACHDCMNHTAIVTKTATNIYTAAQLQFIGDSKISSPLTQVYILPIKKDNGTQVYRVAVEFTAAGWGYGWFGRADLKGFNVN